MHFALKVQVISMGLTAKLDKLKLKTTSEDIEDDSGHAKPDNSDDIDEVDSEYRIYY